MRKIAVFLLLTLLMTVAVSAQSPFVADEAGLLTAEEVRALEADFSEFYTQQGAILAAATVSGFGDQSAAEFAAAYYEAAGYDNNGILLLISQEEGQWYIYTSGICTNAVPDSDAAQIGAALTEDLKAGNYAVAIRTFREMSSEPIVQELTTLREAAEYTRSENGRYVIFGLCGGLAVGVLVALLLKIAAKPARKAGKYL